MISYHLFLAILTTLFDTISLVFYIYIFQKKRKTFVSVGLFILCLFFTETIMFVISEITAGNMSTTAIITRMCISILSTFCLMLLFEASILHCFFVAISYQSIITLSELVSEFIIAHTFHLDEEMLLHISDVIVFMGYTVTFLFITLISVFRKTSLRYDNARYSIALLITPTISVFLSFNENIYRLSITSPESYILLIICLLIINYSNFFVLEKSMSTTRMQEFYKHIQQQNEFQKSKYNQLCSTYKKLRSYHHDTRKRYLFIGECVKNQEYDRILPYLSDSMNELQQSYSRFNTGSLVIDSFISNYALIAEENGIRFTPDLQLDYTMIPVNDYNLSIILGNLMDNALNACLKLEVPSDRYINVCIRTDISLNQFILHIRNSKIEKNIEESANDLIHGYGLKNATDAIENCNGIISIRNSKNSYEVTVIIPFTPPSNRQKPLILSRL